jgi:hypothetical protein
MQTLLIKSLFMFPHNGKKFLQLQLRLNNNSKPYISNYYYFRSTSSQNNNNTNNNQENKNNNSTTNNDTNNSNIQQQQQQRLKLEFTCTHQNECQYVDINNPNRRVCKEISALAYTQGVVLVKCPCDKLHLIADRLGWFEENGTDVFQELLKKGIDDNRNNNNNGVFELVMSNNNNTNNKQTQ